MNPIMSFHYNRRFAREKSAIEIQRMFRGYLVRQSVFQLKIIRKKRMQMEAIIKIQVLQK